MPNLPTPSSPPSLNAPPPNDNSFLIAPPPNSRGRAVWERSAALLDGASEQWSRKQITRPPARGRRDKSAPAPSDFDRWKHCSALNDYSRIFATNGDWQKLKQ